MKLLSTRSDDEPGFSLWKINSSLFCLFREQNTDGWKHGEFSNWRIKGAFRFCWLSCELCSGLKHQQSAGRNMCCVQGAFGHNQHIREWIFTLNDYFGSPDSLEQGTKLQLLLWSCSVFQHLFAPFSARISSVLFFTGAQWGRWRWRYSEVWKHWRAFCLCQTPLIININSAEKRVHCC